MEQSIKTNFHTHTQFCDSHSTAEETVLEAIERGIKILGFSSHAMLPLEDDWHITNDKYSTYCSEIRRLQKTFQDEIQISLGFEADYIEGKTVPSFETYSPYAPDFLIGSVHFVTNEKGTFEADDSPEKILSAVKELYGGNAREAVCRYFELERQMLEKGDFSILGHCDLIQKKNQITGLFSFSDEWFKDELKALVKAIRRNGCIVEINTGAVSRGTDVIYPCDYCLELLHDAGVPVTISSDAHSAQAIDCAFDRAVLKAKKAGYTEKAVPYAGSIRFMKL